jgi:hypothetical protein
MKSRILQGVWSAGVMAGLAAGVLAAVSTPAAALAQDENVCYRCECDVVLGCVCTQIACPVVDP